MKSDILIIGGGQAGSMTAIALRMKKVGSSITIISQENHLPYQRPQLSKGFLEGKINQQMLYIKSGDYYKNNSIKIIKNKSVISINRNKKNVLLDNGEVHEYKTLVIATGSNIITIPFSSKTQNIHYLRTIEDSIQIKRMLDRKKSLAILGGGYIGLEVAATAIKKNLEVSVIDMEERVMKRSVSSEVSSFIQKKHENKGVNFLLKKNVEDVLDYKNKKKIICKDGSHITAEAIVVGVGIKPSVKLAEESGIECKNGILVDDNGMTSDRDVFAVGDCTNHPNSIYGCNIRLESVHNAIEQAKSVASAISGKKNPYHQVPWFWSTQYDIKLKIIGLRKGYDEYFITGNMKEEKFSVIYVKNSKIIAIDTVNDQKTFSYGKKAITSKAKINKRMVEKRF